MLSDLVATSGPSRRRRCVTAEGLFSCDIANRCNRSNAMAGGTKRIERLAPELDRIIEISQPIQELTDGFGGLAGRRARPRTGVVARGRLSRLQRHPHIHNNRRMNYEPGRGASVLLEPTNRANGLTPRSAGAACRLRA
jgi:hypothetical protein